MKTIATTKASNERMNTIKNLLLTTLFFIASTELFAQSKNQNEVLKDTLSSNSIAKHAINTKGTGGVNGRKSSTEVTIPSNGVTKTRTKSNNSNDKIQNPKDRKEEKNLICGKTDHL